VARVAYFVHGRGRGHATRSLAVLDRLQEAGHHLHVFGGGQARDVLGHRDDFQPVRLSGPGPGGVAVAASRFVEDVGTLRALQPEVVVSDGDAPSVLAALSLGIPSVAVGHGMIFSQRALGAPLPILGRLDQAIRAAGATWPCKRRVAVHFAPASPRDARTVIARPELPAHMEPRSEPEGFLLAYFRDDNGAEVLRALRDRGHRIVCFGGATKLPEGVTRKPPSRDGFSRHLSRCAGVVASAGSHLISECALLGIPILALYRRGDHEQGMNARLLEAAGIGVGARLDRVGLQEYERFERMVTRGVGPESTAVWGLPPVSEAVADAVADVIGPARRAAVRWRLHRPGRRSTPTRP
jgi:UDP-N-acetylglucosamine--N-acetylmuramyl-(pentapeptide) pyrophosphoryl-undecaprenol N-acetylglucosamine transferase